MSDIGIIGGGIVGVAAAVRLAEAGAAVELWEREALGAAASGRNSGSVQHPFDPVLTPLHADTVELYRGLLDWSPEPAGLLMLGYDTDAIAGVARRLAESHPELAPTFLDRAAVAAAEPALAPDLVACRLRTAWPVRPHAATAALAERARAAGAALRVGEAAEPWIEDGAVRGVRVAGREHPAGAALVAAGPWSAGLVDPSGAWRPIVALWGAIAEVRLERPPVHVVEEAGVEEINAGPGEPFFSLVTAEGVSALGSTFELSEPDAAALAPRLRERGARFLPALAGASVERSRACPRPQSQDGRPLLGPVPGVSGLWMAAGHGPWGISTGPGSAFLVADAMLGRPTAIPPELAVGRAGAPGSLRRAPT